MSTVRHHFEPDPETPTACVVCALHPAWHPEHQPKEVQKEAFAQAIRDGDEDLVTAFIRGANSRWRSRPA